MSFPMVVVEIGDHVELLSDCIITTGDRGSLKIGAGLLFRMVAKLNRSWNAFKSVRMF